LRELTIHTHLPFPSTPREQHARVIGTPFAIGGVPPVGMHGEHR
jgi:hypothetical protein